MKENSDYYKQMRVRIPKVTYKKYKIICAERDLSMSKQMGALVKEFVDNMGSYVMVLRKLEEKE